MLTVAEQVGTRNEVNQAILAVDDDPNVLAITQMILKKEGYAVCLAQSADQALQRLRETKIDLILLDVMLPDADGYTLCKLIKGSESTRDIPVILLTALDALDSKVRGLDVGASDYLVKPFPQKELVARIRSHLRESEFARQMKVLYDFEKRRAHELAILQELTTEFNKLLDRDQLLHYAARVISTELNFHRCIISMRDPQGSGLKVEATYHPNSQQDLSAVPPLFHEALMDWVAVHSNAAILPDISQEPRFVGLYPDTQSAMAVPLIHQEEIIGVLNVESCRLEAYTTEDLNLLSTVGGHLALALKNAELYSAQKLHSESLKSVVEMRTRELEEQKRFMECIIDSIPIGVYVVDQNYSIVSWNRKRETGILGISREEVIGQDLFAIFPSLSQRKLRREFEQVFFSGRPFETETVSWSSGEKRHYHVRKIPMSVSGDQVTHVITLGDDISERKRLEESVATNEKLASIGKLAAGIAHELNNPLAAIAGCVEGLISRSRDGALRSVQAFEDFPDYLKIIDDEISRCKGIINNLLEFSRQKEMLQQEISVNDTLKQTMELLRHHKAFKQIEVDLRLDPGCPPVIGNDGELRQVFLAMAINAMDAMNQSGKLSLFTGTELWDGRPHVCIRFQDDGVGIPPKHISKIFDPFFTTKPLGKGTGLGLSICYGIVRSHQGFIRVASKESEGSQFYIYIPAKVSRERALS